MNQNRVLFKKSYIPYIDMDTISYVNKINTVKSISTNVSKLHKYLTNKIFLISCHKIPFKDLSKRNVTEQYLNFIFLPPRFSILFYYRDGICRYTDAFKDLSKFKSKYTCTKKSAKVIFHNRENFLYGGKNETN